MNPEYKILKTKCSVCGRTYKKIVPISQDVDTSNFVLASLERNSPTGPVCKSCQNTYRICSNYSGRGYGYKYSCSARRTALDKESTPTFGIEIEVAGNVKNIEKIDKLANGNYQSNPECSIGYDSSLSGAQFELSFSPGTFYWYMYESNLKAICNLLTKDKWATTDGTTGMHIHIGTIKTGEVYSNFQKAAMVDNLFWTIIKVLGEREFNNYCMPVWQRNHHDCITRSSKWGTIEFRMFTSTFDYQKILNRMKFLRQMIENFQFDGSIGWKYFKDTTKQWFFELLDNTTVSITDEEKQRIKDLFNGNALPVGSPINPIAEEWIRRAEQYYQQDEEYDDEEDDEEEEDY